MEEVRTMEKDHSWCAYWYNNSVAMVASVVWCATCIPTVACELSEKARHLSFCSEAIGVLFVCYHVPVVSDL